jgi:hypothetical protein
MKKAFFWLIPLALASLVCNFGRAFPAPAPTPDLSAIVSATLTAVAAQQPAAIPPNSDFIPPMGSISGRLSYPADALPALRVAAFEVKTGEVSYTDLPAGKQTYSFELPVGTYHVVAYVLPTKGFPTGFAGGYTQAVPCGLALECANHNLIPVSVVEAQTTENIDPVDWYAPEGSFPPMPSP